MGSKSILSKKERNLSKCVHAKTGYISGGYALSGYVTAKSGKIYIFSVLTENHSSWAINGIDRVVKTIIDNY